MEDVIKELRSKTLFYNKIVGFREASFLDEGCYDPNTLFVKYEDAKTIIKKCSVGTDSNKHEPLVSQAALQAVPNGGLTDREKSLILWFMELAVKMKMKDYTELSISSIDLDSWYEDYYLENEFPSNALEMDEREGL